MRLLVYGVQNSGATLVALLAGQRAGSMVVPDLWTMYCAPEVPDDVDFCLKATVTTSFPLERHVASFRPDLVVVVTRRPEDTWASLRRKPYAHHNGTVAEKFEVLDDLVARLPPDHLHVVLEDLLERPEQVVSALGARGWVLPERATDLQRTPLQMERDLLERCPGLYESVEWGVGEARVEPLRGDSRLGYVDDTEATSFCKQHSPHLQAFYATRAPRPDRSPVRLTSEARDDAAFQARRRMVTNQLALFESLVADDPAQALALARELCDWAGREPEPWNAHARALEATGDPNGAVTLLDRAAEIVRPDARVDLDLFRSRQALRLGDLDRSEDLAHRVARLSPRTVAAWLVLAEVAHRRQEWSAATEHALAALSLHPRSRQALLLLARVAAASGDQRAARRHVDACLAIGPPLPAAQLLRAQLTEGTGR